MTHRCQSVTTCVVVVEESECESVFGGAHVTRTTFLEVFRQPGARGFPVERIFPLGKVGRVFMSTPPRRNIDTRPDILFPTCLLYTSDAADE